LASEIFLFNEASLNCRVDLKINFDKSVITNNYFPFSLNGLSAAKFEILAPSFTTSFGNDRK
jgi:hypothetical protein